MRPNKLEVKKTAGAGLQIHGEMPEEIQFPEARMKHGPQVMLLACDPWIQFPTDKWDNMVETVFGEMVDLWNEKHAGDSQ